VAVELALTVLMLANLVLGLRVSAPSLPSDAAIDTAEVLTAAITLPAYVYPTAAARTAFYRRLEERLRAFPDVSAVSVASALPLLGAEEQRLEVAGRTRTGDPASVRSVAIGPGYFDAIGLPLIRGRTFADTGDSSGRAQAIVNERFARVYFGDRDPIGQRLALRTRDGAVLASDWLTIVGVAPSIRQRPRPEPDPLVYVAHRSSPAATSVFLVRSGTSPDALASRLREEVRALDPQLPLYRVQTLRRAIREAQWNGRVSGLLMAVLTCIALGFSAVGLYAVTSHAVRHRTQEIGLRVALGARPAHLRRLILRRTGGQLAVGVAVGVACTLIWSRLFAAGQSGVSVADPWSLAVVAGVVAVVALLACLAPLRRATRLDPVAAMRAR
jgi:predicted permease